MKVETLSIYKIEYVYKRIKVVKSRVVLKGQFQRLGTTKLDHSREKKYNNTVDLLHQAKHVCLNLEFVTTKI